MSAAVWIEAGVILLLVRRLGSLAKQRDALRRRVQGYEARAASHVVAAVLSLAVLCAECHTLLTRNEADEATSERVIRRRACRPPIPTFCRTCTNAHSIRAEHGEPPR